MKKTIQKIFALFLAPMVVFSTTSFTIEKHICGENICSLNLEGIENDIFSVEKMYLHPEESCCMDEENSCCFDDDSCCHDERIVVQGLKIKKEKDELIKVVKVLTHPAFNFSVVKDFQEIYQIKDLTHHYKTPQIYRNILTMFQVFLI